VANINDLKDRISAAILTVDGDMLQMALKQFFFLPEDFIHESVVNIIYVNPVF
jgi:hypothetical protein